jgi:histidinol phosphatase-like enzyme
MLHAFDIDGTLVRSFLREGAPLADFDLVELLEHRRGVLVETREHARRASIACPMVLVTNQGGVALGYQSEQQVAEKIRRVREALGWTWAITDVIKTRPLLGIDYFGTPWPMKTVADAQPVAYVSFGMSSSRAVDSRYWVPELDEWRKPGPGMLLQAMHDFNALPEDTLFIGDMETDLEAARRAGCGYMHARDFFGC